MAKKIKSDDSKKADKELKTQFDPNKLSDGDFKKVFDDPRVWEHKRFKELNETAKAGKDALKKLEELEEAKLEEEGKFKELAEKARQRAEEAEKTLQDRIIDNALQAEAVKQGAVDLEAVLKLVDRQTIEYKDGDVIGHDKAVTSLIEGKPYLKNAQPSNIGSPTQPSNEATGVKKFTLSQLQDPKFYEENEEDVLQSMRTGNVIDDMSVTQPSGPAQPQS